MRTTRPSLVALLVALLLALPLLAACTENAQPAAGGADGRTVTVTASDDACDVSGVEVPAGTVTFDVINAGSQVTEFYLLGADGLGILGEVESIGPGIERPLVVSVPAGTYQTACKPGMTGEGIRADFTVTESDEDISVAADDPAAVGLAQDNYESYVEDQSAQLLAKTADFVDRYERGDDASARALYPRARVHWERIETVAESFGDLDPLMDAREADLEPGQEWGGWHLIEKDLWPARAEDGYQALTPEQRTAYAQDLLVNTTELDSRVQDLDVTLDQITNGSRGLLEEVATGKVTGEEEYWSRTDLWDFQANIDGARVGFEGVQPILDEKDPELSAELVERFDALQVLLDEQREGDGFVAYDDLDETEVKGLADAVNALAEPLSRLTAAVLG